MFPPPTGSDAPIHLGREPMNECEGVQLECRQCDAFPSNRFVARNDTTFDVVIGPSANPRGYTAITGKTNFRTVYREFHDIC